MITWSGSFPFLIRLRDFAREDAILPAPEDWPRLIAPHIANEMPNGWVHDKLRAGKAIVLIDGLDEISDTKRQTVIEWIKDLIYNYRLSRFVVSSRPESSKSVAEIFWPMELRLSTMPIDNFLKDLALRGVFNKPLKEDDVPLLQEEMDRQTRKMKEYWKKEAETALSLPVTLSDKPLNQYSSISASLVEKLTSEPNFSREMLGRAFISRGALRRRYIRMLERWQKKALRVWDRSLDVQRMSDFAINSFIFNWHKAVADAEGNLPSERDELSKMAENLVKQLKAHRALRNLATNPLLCAMMCALHRETQQDLPHDRIS